MFEAATARAEHTRTAATNIGDVVSAVPGSGQAFDAAQQATGRIQTDLIGHADQVEAVGRAASLAEDEVRGVKSVWQALQRRAYDDGFTIDKETNEISYTMPADPKKQTEMQVKFNRLWHDIHDLLDRANTADDDLAAAIRGATGDESAADLNRELDQRGEPPLPMDEQAGRQDGQAAIDGHLSDEAQQRLAAATHLSDQQRLDLQNGNLVLAPDQLAYLSGLSKQFGGMNPNQILKAMDDEAEGGKGIANAFAIASNPNVNTGQFGAGKYGQAPTKGDLSMLPSGVQQVLKAPALETFPGQPMTQGGPPMPQAAPMVNPGLKGLADIVSRTDPNLQVGSGLDTALMGKTQELLRGSESAVLPMMADGSHEELPRWYHDKVDPTLQSMMNAISPDGKVLHDTLSAPGAEGFLNQLHTHQWQDDGLAAQNLFRTVDSDAVITNPGDPVQQVLAQRAAETARIEATYLGDSKHDLLNLAGGHDSLGQVNPELTRGLARSLSHYLPSMMGDGFGNTGDFGGMLPGDHDHDNLLQAKNVVAALSSDPNAAGILRDASHQFGDAYLNETADAIATGQGDAEQHMAALGRLHATMDVGQATVANDLQLDQHAAAQDAFENKQAWIAFWGNLGGQIPVIDHVADFAKDGLMAAQHGPEAVERITSEARGSSPVLYSLLQDLQARGVGDTSALNGLLDPNDPNHFQDYGNAFNEYNEGRSWDAMGQYLDHNEFLKNPNRLMAMYLEKYSSGLHNGLPGVDQTGPAE